VAQAAVFGLTAAQTDMQGNTASVISC